MKQNAYYLQGKHNALVGVVFICLLYCNSTISVDLENALGTFDSHLRIISKAFHSNDVVPHSLASLPTFTVWVQECNKLKTLRSSGSMPKVTPVKLSLFSMVMNTLIERFDQKRGKNQLWLTPFSKDASVYVAKKLASDGETIYFHADLHGDLKSLMAYLQILYNKGVIDDSWHITRSNKIIFLGDYIDRGLYGLEVLYTLMILVYNNPESVTLIRGNHESKEIYSSYNDNEISPKVVNQGIDAQLFFTTLNTFFDTLPSALFLRMPTDAFLFFTHGAHDHMHVTLEQFLQNNRLLFDACSSIEGESVGNYSWSDYFPKSSAKTAPDFNIHRDAGFVHYQQETINWMNARRIYAIFHGHDHENSQLWGNDRGFIAHDPYKRVYGLQIAPDTTYGKRLDYIKDHYGKITIMNGGNVMVKIEEVPAPGLV